MNSNNTSSIILEGSYEYDETATTTTTTHHQEGTTQEGSIRLANDDDPGKTGRLSTNPGRHVTTTTTTQQSSSTSTPSDQDLVNSLLQKYYYNNTAESELKPTTTQLHSTKPTGILLQHDSHPITPTTTTTGNINDTTSTTSLYYIEDDEGMVLFNNGGLRSIRMSLNESSIVGERIASMTGSILDQLNYDSVSSFDEFNHTYNILPVTTSTVRKRVEEQVPHNLIGSINNICCSQTSSLLTALSTDGTTTELDEDIIDDDDDDMDILNAPPLFSPSAGEETSNLVTTTYGINFSTDSLDNNNSSLRRSLLSRPHNNLYTLTFQDTTNNSQSQLGSSYINGGSGNNNTQVKLYDLNRSITMTTSSSASSGNNNNHHRTSSSISVQTSDDFGKSCSNNSNTSNKATAPLYVCYPNYTLPDLKFLNSSTTGQLNPGLSTSGPYKLIPYRRPLSSIETKAGHELRQGLRPSSSSSGQRRRPLSTNDVELLRNRLQTMPDPESLAMLLPKEYTQFLQQPNDNNQDYSKQDNRESNNVTNGNGSSITTKEENEVKLRRLRDVRRTRRGFSLQELPEILELTSEIEKNLVVFEKYSNIGSNSSKTDQNTTSGTKAPHNSPYTSSANTTNIMRNFNITRNDVQYRKQEEDYEGMNSTTGSTNSSSTIMMIEKRGMTSELEEIVSRVLHLCANSLPDKYVQDSNRRRKSADVTGPHSTTPVVTSGSTGGEGVLRLLCPALYSLLSDGLTSHIDTLFGRIPNSVWRLIEASIQHGPSGTALAELVMRINSEDLLAEGPMKFNSFICGLLNLGCLSVWLKCFRTLDRLLRSHYTQDAYLYNANTSTRTLFQRVLESVSRLNSVTFQLDLFHELRELQNEFKLQLSSKKKLGYNYKDSKTLKLDSKKSKYLSNQYKKSQMKRSVSDERPLTSAGSSDENASHFPKSKTALNLSNQKTMQLANNLALKKNNASVSGAVLRRPQTRDSNESTTEKGSAEVLRQNTTKKQQRPKSLDYNSVTSRQTYIPHGQHQMTSAPDSKQSDKPPKFKQLQLQWESLTNVNTETTGNNTTGVVGGGCAAPGGGSSTSYSRIPRPISMTSPITATPGHYANNAALQLQQQYSTPSNQQHHGNKKHPPTR